MTAGMSPRPRAKKFNFQLRQTTIAYLDGQQFVDGFEFLSNVLVCGTSLPHETRLRPTYTPFPKILELAANLVVHPKFTTKAKSPDAVKHADEALRFLRFLNETVGPLHANIAGAFTFQPGRRGVRPRGNQGSDSQDNEESLDRLHSAYAREKSLFSQVEDIWQIVGWAFNCSVMCRKRWDRWKLWLSYIVDTMEQDFEERLVQCDKGCPTPLAEESLVFTSLEACSGGAGGGRRVMRSILADGGERSLKEFPEIFKNETKERKKPKDNSRRKTLDIENDEWGDYEEDDDADEGSSDESNEHPKRDTVGLVDTDAIILRQRFIILLAKVADALSEKYMLPEDVFDIISEFARQLPLDIFIPFFSSSWHELPISLQSALLINTSLPFLIDRPRRIDFRGFDQKLLIEHILPFGANSHNLIDHAKLGILVERILQVFHEAKALPTSDEFKRAVRRGIAERQQRSTEDAAKKLRTNSHDEEKALSELKMSGERIKLFLELVAIAPANLDTDSDDDILSDLTSLASP